MAAGTPLPSVCIPLNRGCAGWRWSAQRAPGLCQLCQRSPWPRVTQGKTAGTASSAPRRGEQHCTEHSAQPEEQEDAGICQGVMSHVSQPWTRFSTQGKTEITAVKQLINVLANIFSNCVKLNHLILGREGQIRNYSGISPLNSRHLLL